jgi:lipid II:glycine glycyltransferase (peptidoglycan interpeptide bridge formation enzyme)
MKQDKLKAASLQQTEEEDLVSEFEAIKNKKVEKATTRIVNIKIRVGCGCGGSYDKYHVEVPIDSDIEDGDYFDDFEDWMDNIEDGWV